MNPLSVYWSPWHRRPTDYEYFLQLQPAVVKIMDGGAPDYAWVHGTLPGALVLARDWALSEQKSDMLRDPEGTGKRHAQEWKAKQPALLFDPGRTLVLGINEPAVWEAGVPEALRVYTIAFLDACRGLGLRAGAMQLSVGWPGNHGPNEPPDWSPWYGVEEAIRAGNHALVLHEYWATGGPGESWGWTAGRFTKCPWNVPIIIGECGLDMGVVQDPATLPGNRGWQGNVDAATYAAQCAEYVRLALEDARFFAATAFTTDYQSAEWQSFDTEPARGALISEAASLPAAQWYHGELQPKPEPPSEEGGLVHPLPPGSFTITQHFWERPEAYADFGMPGHNGTDLAAASGTPVRVLAAGVVAYAGVDPGYGNYVRVFHAGYMAHSFYAHLSRIDVRPGDVLEAGVVLGAVGNTGNSSGPHLHLEIRLGDADNYATIAPMPKGRLCPESWCALFGLNLAPG